MLRVQSWEKEKAEAGIIDCTRVAQPYQEQSAGITSRITLTWPEGAVRKRYIKISNSERPAGLRRGMGAIAVSARQSGKTTCSRNRGNVKAMESNNTCTKRAERSEKSARALSGIQINARAFSLMPTQAAVRAADELTAQLRGARFVSTAQKRPCFPRPNRL